MRGEWTAPEHGRETVAAWAERWRPSVVHLKPSSLSRLDATLHEHVLPRWGDVALSAVRNADVRGWLADLLAAGMSASSARKAVHVLRRILAAAVADQRLPYDPADDVPLPSDVTGEQRFLTADQVDDLADGMSAVLYGEGRRYRALVLVAALGRLRFGELGALRRIRVDVLRARVEVAETLSAVGGELSFVTPKSKRSRRTVPLPRALRPSWTSTWPATRRPTPTRWCSRRRPAHRCVARGSVGRGGSRRSRPPSSSRSSSMSCATPTCQC